MATSSSLPTSPFLRVGIIGGMGTEAGIALLSHLTEIQKRGWSVSSDSGYVGIHYSSVPEVHDRTAFLSGKGKDPVPGLQRHINGFISFADVMGAVCNTVHAPAIMDRIVLTTPSIPLVNLIEATKCFVARNHGGKKIGAIVTDGTKRVGLFDSLAPIYPDEEFQKKVMCAIYAVKGGFLRKEEDVSEEDYKAGILSALRAYTYTREYAETLTADDIKSPGEWFSEVADHLKSKGAEIILEGCTEVPLALSEYDLPLVDTIKILAFALLAVARNPDLKKYFDEHKGKDSWDVTIANRMVSSLLEAELELSRYHPRLSNYMGIMAPRRSPLDTGAGAIVIGHTPERGGVGTHDVTAIAPVSLTASVTVSPAAAAAGAGTTIATAIASDAVSPAATITSAATGAGTPIATAIASVAVSPAAAITSAIAARAGGKETPPLSLTAAAIVAVGGLAPRALEPSSHAHADSVAQRPRIQRSVSF